MSQKDILYLIYDGKCPICSRAAQILKIRKSIGTLEIINARSNHSLVDMVKKEGYNLNDGVILIYNNNLYYGSDAMNIIAMIGSPVDFINKINVILFRSKILSSILYPVFKFIRKCLLTILGVKGIKPDKTQPIFKSVFGDSWGSLPLVFQKRYANRPFCNDIVKLEGRMDIILSKPVMVIKPILKLFKILAPDEGKNIPVTICCASDNTACYTMKRKFYILSDKPYIFNSKFLKRKSSEIIEMTKFGFGWRANCIYNEGKIQLIHKGYVFQIFGFIVPLPITYLVGTVYAEEEAIDDNNFRMLVNITHPWCGKIFEYKGKFKVL